MILPKIDQLKVKGTAMFYAILLCLVLTISSLLFATVFISLDRTIDEHWEFSQLNADSRSAMRLALSGQAGAVKFGENRFSTIRKRQWGMWEIVDVISINTSDTIQNIALVGNELIEGIELYVEDHGYPLRLGGEVNIEGRWFVPKRGVTEESAAGVHFSGDLNSLTMSTSSAQLPLTTKSQNLSNRLLKETKIGLIEADFVYDSANFKEVGFIHRLSTLVPGSYAGYQIFLCSDSVVLTKDHSLDKVIIEAPKVVIEEGFEGSCQIFSPLIKVTKGAVLKYPSALCSLGVGSRVNVQGHVTGLVFGGNQSAQITIEENGVAIGQVYNLGKTQIEGRLEGQILASTLVYYKNGVRHDNAIIDGDVGPLESIGHFSGAISNGTYKKVMSWLE